jgi:hypothetical protein
MAESTGYILAAAGAVVANDLIFAPIVQGGGPQWDALNWRIIPATAIAALALAGLEQLSPPFAKGLAMLALFAALIQPWGKAPSPIDNVAKFLKVK